MHPQLRNGDMRDRSEVGIGDTKCAGCAVGGYIPSHLTSFVAVATPPGGRSCLACSHLSAPQRL